MDGKCRKIFVFDKEKKKNKSWVEVMVKRKVNDMLI